MWKFKEPGIAKVILETKENKAKFSRWLIQCALSAPVDKMTKGTEEWV